MARTRLTGHPDKKGVRNAAKREGKRAKIVTVESIPARGETDAYGEPFDGLPGDRLKVNAVGATELASGTADAQRAVGGGHIKSGSVGDSHINGQLAKNTISGAGTWPDSDIPQLSKAKIAGAGTFSKGEISGAGTWSKGEISNAGVWPDGDIPGSIARKSDIPDVSKYATDEQIKDFTTGGQVSAKIAAAFRAHVKKYHSKK
jgi:hypothetical protein